MLEYVAKRLFRAARLLLARQARTGELGAGAPIQFSRSPYILRWLVSRPPRPETISAVRAALAQP